MLLPFREERRVPMPRPVQATIVPGAPAVVTVVSSRGTRHRITAHLGLLQIMELDEPGEDGQPKFEVGWTIVMQKQDNVE